MRACQHILVWVLRVGAVSLAFMDLWFLMDTPIVSSDEVVRLNFSGPPIVWNAAPFVRSFDTPLLLLAAAEILALLLRRAKPA